jgi:hypothetical protein
MYDRGQGWWEPERYQFGALFVDGDSLLSLNKFQIAIDPYAQWVMKNYGYDGNRASGVLINNAPMRANTVSANMRLQAYLWHFISLPFDVKVSDIAWDNANQLFAIYKYDFHKAKEPTIQAVSDGVDGEKNVKIAQACFASLFDLNSVDNLVKFNKKGEPTRLPNDVLAKAGDIFIWRVNNSQMKEWWRRSGKDSKGIDKYEMQEIESNPYCNVLIDNRPGVCLIAIEKSKAWSSKPDILRDMLLDNFNTILADKFDLEMRIEARMNPKDIWDFVHERLYEHGDYIRKVSFVFQNPKKINKTNAMEVKSNRLKSMLRTVEISDALKGFFTMEFDRYSNGKISQENKDMAEMGRWCGENGYDIIITFKEFKTYRINDYVRAYYPMTLDVLQGFSIGALATDGKTKLESWFDLVDEQTKDYVNESEVPKRRNKTRK